MKRIKYNILLLLMSFITLCSAPSYARGINEIKEDMKNRLPVIVELKSRGIIGENNSGYLEYTGEKIEKKDIVDAENADRKIVYRVIAKTENTELAVVEKIRAGKIAQKAEPGDWLKDDKGNWYQKN